MMLWSAVSEKPAPSGNEGSLLISSKHRHIWTHHSTVSSPKTDDTSLDKLSLESTVFHYHCEFFILQCGGISIQEWVPYELPYLEVAGSLSSTNLRISMKDHQVNFLPSSQVIIPWHMVNCRVPYADECLTQSPKCQRIHRTVK
jgi:hypothetical protein